jgi:hypothetical protein
MSTRLETPSNTAHNCCSVMVVSGTGLLPVLPSVSLSWPEPPQELRQLLAIHYRFPVTKPHSKWPEPACRTYKQSDLWWPWVQMVSEADWSLVASQPHVLGRCRAQTERLLTSKRALSNWPSSPPDGLPHDLPNLLSVPPKMTLRWYS